jgi:hypothetical protein
MIKYNDDDTVSVEKIKTIVFVENEKQADHYFKLFKIMLFDKVKHTITSWDFRRIEGDYFIIDFKELNSASRGNRAHFVMNLVQDKVLHQEVAMPVASYFDYVKRDKKWRHIFEDTRD